MTPRQSHDASVCQTNPCSKRSAISEQQKAENRGSEKSHRCALSAEPATAHQPVFLLLIIEDCFFQPRGSVVLLDFHFSLPFIPFSYCPSNLPKNIVPTHQHWSTTHVPCQSARAASDAVVPTRSAKAENDRVEDTGMGQGERRRGGGGWLLLPWQPCVFVSARESDKR